MKVTKLNKLVEDLRITNEIFIKVPIPPVPHYTISIFDAVNPERNGTYELLNATGVITIGNKLP